MAPGGWPASDRHQFCLGASPQLRSLARRRARRNWSTSGSFDSDSWARLQAEMIGTYLAEYSCTYKPVRHGRPGIGATASSKFVPLK